MLALSLSGMLITLLLLVLLPKNMHLFELTFNGMAAFYFYSYQFSMFTNMHLVSVSTEIDKAIASIVIRFITIPVIILLFLELYIALNSWLAKAALTITFSFLLALLQYITKQAGFINQTELVTLWSVPIWFAFLLLCLGVMKCFRRFALKEVWLP